MTDNPRPYADAAALYFAAGWRPLPIKGKFPPPKGFTGTDGAVPSYPDIQAWIDGAEGKLNVGLRLPRHVLGIDVDDYGTKTGGRTLAEHEAKWGPLPATWVSSSRGDGVSGIRLFAVPEGLQWPGELRGGGVELIQHKHRYVMVWPSIHPETGAQYRWSDAESGSPVDSWLAYGEAAYLPNADDLPNLPDAWIAGLTEGRLATDVAKADLGDAQAAAWLLQHGSGAPCAATSRALARCSAELTAPGASRHDAAMRGVARIAHLVTEGHNGAVLALGQLRAAFDAATGDPSRSGEWERLITGAVQIAAMHEPAPFDPCLSPFTVGHAPASPFKQESPWKAPSAPSPTGASTASANASYSVAGTTASQPVVDLSSFGSMGNGALSLAHDPFVSGRPVIDPFALEAIAWPPSEPSSIGSAASSTDTTGAGGMGLPGAGSSPAARDAADGHPTAARPARTSWWPIDLDPILSGEQREQPPEVLYRSDGHGLFYLGRVNGLLGPSESGKSWIALAACEQVLAAGHHVSYLDFEDTASGVVGRLLGMGVDSDVIRERFHYTGPDEAPAPEQMADLAASLEEHAPRLVVLDGFNAAMAISGLDLMSNTDATRFHQALLKPITRNDRAILYVDHTPKSKLDESSGGIGAQAKRAMTSGCAIRVEKSAEFGPGIVGYLKLIVDKDRAGQVREISAGARNAGTAVIDGSTGITEIVVNAPESNVDPDTGERKPFRPTHYMQRVSDLLGRVSDGMSKSEIAKELGGKRSAVLAAVDCLISEGFVALASAARGAHVCSLISPFSETSLTPFADQFPPVPDQFPTSSRELVKSDRLTSSHQFPDPPVGGLGREPVEPDAAGTAESSQDTLEGNCSWRDGNLVNRLTGEVIRSRA